MLKTIPKSNVSRRSFKVHKDWTVTDSDYVIETTSDSSGDDRLRGIYHGLISKYYRSDANVFNLYGVVRNPVNISSERRKYETLKVLSLPQAIYGEGIKKSSITFENNTTNTVYYDDGFGLITTDTPLYFLISLDLQIAELVIEDNDGEQFTLTIGNIDLNNGETILTYGSSTDSVVFALIDFENETLQTLTPISIEGLSIDRLAFGNVFYHEGIFAFSDRTGDLSSYTLRYKSTQTIHETEVLISSKAGEFNYSQNPSAVDVTLSGSYDFQTTSVFNQYAGGAVKIKEVLDISRKNTFVGSFDTSISGSWDDYFESSSINPTGSYIAPFITTIGLYDDDGDMIAVAKLPKPIKNLPDYDVNFIVRFDT